MNFRRRTNPQSRVYSYRTASSFIYRCYVVCGTAALHRQASTAVQQLVLEDIIQNTVQQLSESVVVLNEVVVMSVAVRRALFEFDTSGINLLYFQVNTVVGLFWIMLKISTWLVVYFVPSQKTILPFVPLFTICITSPKTLYAIYSIYLIATL